MSLEDEIRKQEAKSAGRLAREAVSKWRQTLEGEMSEEAARKFLVGMIEDNERLEDENDALHVRAKAAEAHIEAAEAGWVAARGHLDRVLSVAWRWVNHAQKQGVDPDDVDLRWLEEAEKFVEGVG